VSSPDPDQAPPAGPAGRPRQIAARTLAVTSGRPEPRPGAPAGVPITLTSTYLASDGGTAPGDPVYGRWSNATWEALEDAVGALEGGRALAFGSGMAAISAVLGLVPVAGTVVLPVGAYSGSIALARDLEAAGRLRVRQVPVGDTAAVLTAMAGADLALLESPTNPLLEVADLPALAAGARRHGVLLAVDSTFATPLLQRPLQLGADIVVHSATKYLSGHSDVLLGVTVTARKDLAARLTTARTLHGAIPGPWEAWLVLRGIRTLALRVERAGENAAELARRLAAHPAVARVRHPSLPDDPGHQRALSQMDGFGAIIAIEPVGGPDAAERLCALTRLWVHATSLGGVESSLERRRRHAAESDAVPEALVRLSVGIEDVEDLWADLAWALDAAHREPGPLVGTAR
jgi:cystathionine gamma-synthase